MNQHEQLKRMRALHKDAVRLKDAIKDEINEILDDIAERRKFADECDERAKQSNRTWDGKQPDFWYEAGHIWMKATDNHRGQSVLVAKDRQGMRPLDCFEAERIAKLGKVTEFGDFACYNSDETKIQHWPIAWASCTQDEVDQYQGGKFVSVVLADKMKLVKEATKDQPEQVDPLLEDPFDHVPAVPQKWPTFSETPNSSIPDPGPGYRLLSKEPPERLLDTDEGFFANGRDGGQWLSVNYIGGDQLPLVYYRRKIEAANPSEAPNSSLPDPEPKPRISEPVFKVVPAPDGSTKDPYLAPLPEIDDDDAEEPQYREPTQADLANGPIDVEVCDDTNCDLNWEKRQLYAILPIKCVFPYIVGNPGLGGGTQSWKHARIKVEG